jgi:predicted ATPase/DNA-binding SARP family transcriptional activator
VLDIGVLGPVVACREGAQLPLRGGRQRALLAALAVDAGAVVPGDVLVERVWGDRLPANAANALQQQVLKLRRVVGDSAIAFAPPGYRLATQPDALDAARFEHLVATARGRAERHPAETVRLVDEALALWRGPAYADLAYEDWAAVEAARLDELRREAEELRVEALMRSGRNTDAIHALEGLVRENPLRERVHAFRMLALYRDGRQAEALAAYTTARTTIVEQLGVEPGRQLRALHERVLRQDPALDDAPVSRASPAAASSRGGPALIGRDAELADVRRLVIDERERLVTLTGPGGVGKTTLARAVAAELALTRDPPPAFVELAAVQEPAAVVAAIADALELTGAETPDAVAAAVGDRPFVVVLDNFEHLTGSASAVAALLDAAPRCQAVVTSRIPLRTEGEVVVTLAPLTLPPAVTGLTPAQLTAASSAARLFVERARVADPRFELDAANADTVTRVCRALDGLPLALELAAARLRHVSLAELERRLDRRLAVLTRGSPDAPARHRSLRAAIDVSHELLEPDARAVFARLAAFTGSASLEAIEAVCGDGVAALDGLSALIEGNLVARRELRGRSRYEMLETIAEYAREQLARSGEAGVAYERLTAHLLELVEGATGGRLYTIDPPVFDALAEEHANFVAAIARAVEAGDGVTALRIATAMGPHWHRHGHRREGIRWIRAGLALAAGAPASLRARALAYEGALGADLPAPVDDARATLLEAHRLAEEIGDLRAELVAAGGLGIFGLRRGELDAAAAWLERVLAIARRSGDRGLEAFALSDLAYSDLLAGRVDVARARCEEALELAREQGLAAVQAFSATNLAIALLERGETREAAARAHDALACALTTTELEAAAHALGCLAAGLCRLREDDLALRLMGATDALSERLGIDLQPLEARHRTETLASLRERIDAASFDREWAIGRRTQPEEALELVAARERTAAGTTGSRAG